MKDLVPDRDSNPLINRVPKESLPTMMIGADKRVLVGSEIPGVSLGYDGILEIKVVAGCKISVDDGSKVQLTRAVG